MTIPSEFNHMNPSHLRASESVSSNQDGTPSTITSRLPSNSVSTQATASGDAAPPTSRPPTPNIKNVKHPSRKWFVGVKWNARVVHIALTVTATISAILFSIALSWRYVLRNIDYSIPLIGDPLRKVSLVADFIALDLTAGSLTVDWYPLPHLCSEPEAIINFYFDPNLLINTNNPNSNTNTATVPSDKPPTTPTFQFNTTSRCNPGIRDSFPTFRTSGKVTGVQTNGIGGLTEGNIQLYPFDVYQVQFSMFAEMNNTNETVGIIVEKPFGAPVNFAIELDNSDTSSTVNLPEGLIISLHAKRSVAVKILAILIVCANWIVTIAFIYITAACLVWEDERIVTQLFALPVAALFAFTSVRSSLPGAPTGFGAFIDFVGILPNLAVISLCSAVLLFLVLWRRIRSQSVPRDEEAAKHVMGIVWQCSQKLAQDEKAAQSLLGVWRHIQNELEKERA